MKKNIYNSQIDLAFTSNEASYVDFKDKTAVVIDVLRATTSIITALNNNANKIIPSVSIIEAKKISKKFKQGKSLLCGEREGLKINGFDVGNSPIEFSKDIVSDKTLIMATTNGTLAIRKTERASLTLIASLVNASAVAKMIIKNKSKQVVFVCAGRENRFSLEDTVCAGMVIKNIIINYTQISDSCNVALMLYEKWHKNIKAMIYNSYHGKYLLDIGMGKDLDFSSQENIYNIVPIYKRGIIERSKTNL